MVILICVILFALLCCYVSKDKGSVKMEIAIMSISLVIGVIGIMNWF